MSAAWPVMCCDVGEPLTSGWELSFGHLKPEPIMMGQLKCWRNGSRTFSQRAFRLAICSWFGVLSIPYLEAVAERVNSSSEKCSVSCIMKVEGLEFMV